MERKLATIQKVLEVNPIEGADKIVMVKINGWECVVKKDEFKVDDLVVYIEVDSIMPEKPEYEFLRPRNFRIKTIKLKGQISQGLVLPLSVLPNKSIKQIYSYSNIGKDVTELLGVTKYLTPSERDEIRKVEVNHNKLNRFMKRYSWYRRLFLSRTQKQEFPYWISKTDEERIQNIPQILEQFKDKVVYVTEKVDYQSVTFTGKIITKNIPLIGKFLPKKFQFVVCSRNLTVTDKNTLYWKIAKKYSIEEILKANPTLTIQGEQGDTKVQGNKYGITQPMLWVFNIIDHERNYHYDYADMSKFCWKYNLEVVPLLRVETLSKLGSTVQELVEYSKGKSVINNKIDREGVVVRCIEDGKKIISFKIINPDFLIKYDL